MKKAYTFILTILSFYFASAQNPIADFDASQPVLCANGCINFTNLSTNATAWQWTFSGAIDSTSTAQNPGYICYEIPGIYNVTLIAINGSKSDTVTFANYITVYSEPPVPRITQSYDTLFCSTDSSYTSYQWYEDTMAIIGANSFYLVINHGGNYNVAVANENDCAISVGINISDSSFYSYPPVSNFNTSDTVVCANNCIAFNNLSSYGTSYQWSFPGAVPSSSTEASPQSVCYATPGAYSVTLITTNSYGSDTLTKNNYIDVVPALASPVITQSGDTLYCSTNAAYASYQWFLNGSAVNGATDTLLFVSQNGNYTVQVYSSSGCSLSASFTYTLFLPVASFSASDTVICVNGCVYFYNLSQNYTSSVWLFPGSNNNYGDTINGNGFACYNSSGSYNVTLIVSDGYNSDTLTVNNYITVISPPPAPVITQSNDTLFSSTNPSYTAYQWYENSVIINGATDTLLPGISNNAVYMVAVTNSNGCTSSGSIVLGHPVTANFYTSDSDICAGSCINFFNLSTDATSWQWIFNGALDSTSTAENPPNICYASPGSYNVTLIAMNGSAGDTITYSNYISVLPSPSMPVIRQSHDTLFCLTDPSYVSYQWYSDTNLIAGATDTILIVNHNGNYEVQVTNQYGCKIASGLNVLIGSNCSANFTIAADTGQLHHYIVTNNATGAPPISYYWSWGDGTHDTIPYPTHTYADSGFYTICLSITDYTGCQSTYCDSAFHAMRTTNTMVSMTVVPGNPLGIQPITPQTPQVTIYPNPATNQLNIHFSSIYSSETVTVSLLNVLGQESAVMQRKEENMAIDISELSNGIYFVKIVSESGSWMGKFVKEK